MINSLGSNTPDHAPSPNNPVKTLELFPKSLSDWLANKADYTTGAPGLTIDSGTGATYGGNAEDTTTFVADYPVVFLAAGSGGSIISFLLLSAQDGFHFEDDGGEDIAIIRAMFADVPAGFDWAGGGPIRFREVTDCVTIDGTPTTVYRQVLASDYYTDALGNT